MQDDRTLTVDANDARVLAQAAADYASEAVRRAEADLVDFAGARDGLPWPTVGDAASTLRQALAVAEAIERLSPRCERRGRGEVVELRGPA